MLIATLSKQHFFFIKRKNAIGMSFVIKFVCVRVSGLYSFQRIININFIKITNGTNCLLRFEMFSRMGKQAKR